VVLRSLVVQFGLKRCCASRYNADDVSLEHIIVALCLGFALVLSIRAILLPDKRRRIIIPAAALSLLGVYELKIDHWEKTVSAAIRLDLFFEIPLVVAFILWGVLASWALSQMQSLGPRDTFAAAGISEKESREIVEGVEQSAFDTPDSWNKELRVKRVELGAAPGVVVQG
jgi:hypothetical protein